MMNLALNARDAMRGGGRLTIETRNLEVPDSDGRDSRSAEIPPGPTSSSGARHGAGHDHGGEGSPLRAFFTTAGHPEHGAGLTTVYGIVVQSGGYIWVESEPGLGQLPPLLPPVPVDEAGEGFVAAVMSPLGGTETVLVVEDEEAVGRWSAGCSASRATR
jgi:hypothetical protein